MKIIGRTLISDSFGITLPTLPDKPEPTPEERAAAQKADRLPTPELQKVYELSDTDMSYVSGLSGFPQIFSYDVTGRYPRERRIPVRSRVKVAEWFANMRRIVGVKVK